jgi:hypothetical protein
VGRLEARKRHILSGNWNIYSLGGCVAFEVSKRLEDFGASHKDHFWRRPTIALMSDPVSRFQYNLHDLPREFINYFINDATGAHLRELDRVPPGATAVIDITRDIFTGVVELEPGVFVMNPLDAISIIDGLTHETMSAAILEKALRSPAKIVTPRNPAHEDRFLEIWKENIDKFLSYISARFDDVVLLEIFLTSEIMSPRKDGELDPNYVKRTNSLLLSMYDHIRDRPNIVFASINNSRLITAHEVSWNGPNYTHFVDETYALFCDSVRSALNQHHSPHHSMLEKTAFERAKKYEDLKRHVEKLQHEHQAALDSVDSLTQSVSRLTLDISASQAANLQTAAALAATQDELTHMRLLRDNAISDAERLAAALSQRETYLTERQTRLEKELAQERRPLGARLVRTAARQTYPLRKSLGLAGRDKNLPFTRT